MGVGGLIAARSPTPEAVGKGLFTGTRGTLPSSVRGGSTEEGATGGVGTLGEGEKGPAPGGAGSTASAAPGRARAPSSKGAPQNLQKREPATQFPRQREHVTTLRGTAPEAAMSTTGAPTILSPS